MSARLKKLSQIIYFFDNIHQKTTIYLTNDVLTCANK